MFGPHLGEGKRTSSRLDQSAGADSPSENDPQLFPGRALWGVAPQRRPTAFGPSFAASEGRLDDQRT